MEKKIKKLKKTYKRVLTIAGSDSGGGAGIQADLKSIAANGCYGLSVITALTAQNTKGVFGIYPVPVDFVQQQLQVVLSDIGSNAIKIGMLFSSELIEMIASEFCIICKQIPHKQLICLENFVLINIRISVIFSLFKHFISLEFISLSNSSRAHC